MSRRGLTSIGIRKINSSQIDGGGIIVGSTYIHTNSADQFYSVGTSIALIGAPTKISFKAPGNGKVKIRISFHLVHLDSGTSGAAFNIGIYSNNNNGVTGYLKDIDGSQWNGLTVAQYDETDNSNVVVDAYFSGLTGLKTYEWEIHGKSSASNSHRVYYGNNRAPFVVEAISLPSSISISSVTETSFNNGL